VLPDRLADLEREYDAVVAELEDPSTAADPRRLRDLSRRHHQLEQVVVVWRGLQEAEADLDAAREMLADASGAERDLARSEVAQAQSDVDRLEEELRVRLLPRDPNDGRNVIMEIRGAEGGEEANLFAKDLFEMYQRYAAQRGWRTEVLASSPSERDGLNEVTFVVKGSDAWQRLEHEGGPHRVQRVPVTESQGRIHTSSAAVTVLPEAEEVDVSIDPSDLKIDVYRSTGPGGQSVNTTDSAVRITHLPTGADGTDELWKLNQYYERLDDFFEEKGLARNPFLPPPAAPLFELHNLTSDPEERRNVAEQRPAVRATMLAVLETERWAKRLVPDLRNPVG